MASPRRIKIESVILRCLIIGGGLCFYVGLIAGAIDASRGSWKVFVIPPLLAVVVAIPLLAVLSRIYGWGRGRSAPLIPPGALAKIGGSPALSAHLASLVRKQPGADCYLCSIELFFDGNEDPGSIAANMAGHPGLVEFRRCLTGIRERPEVQDVLLGIVDFPEGEWPYAEIVFVFTSATPDTVWSWAKILDADAAGTGWHYQTPAGASPCEPGKQPVHLWWD